MLLSLRYRVRGPNRRTPFRVWKRIHHHRSFNLAKIFFDLSFPIVAGPFLKDVVRDGVPRIVNAHKKEEQCCRAN